MSYFILPINFIPFLSISTYADIITVFLFHFPHLSSRLFLFPIKSPFLLYRRLSAAVEPRVVGSAFLRLTVAPPPSLCSWLICLRVAVTQLSGRTNNVPFKEITSLLSHQLEEK